MKNLIPDTPRSCLKAMASTANNRASWNRQWERFYKIYYNFIETCVKNRFARYNFNNLSEFLLKDAVALVFTNLISAVKLYDPEKSRFHKYLYGIIKHSVKQAIKARKRDSNAAVFDEAKNEIRYFLKENSGDSQFENLIIKTAFVDELADEKVFVNEISEEERRLARNALYAELVEETKSRVSPRMAMVFQMRVIEELSAEETAKRLGISRNIVDNEKYRFIKKLNEIAREETYASEIENLKEQ